MTTIEYLGKCLIAETGRKRILVIGDLHIGWEESLNKTGIFMSGKMYAEIIEELKKVFEKAGRIDEVVLLGDVKHEFGDITRQERKGVSDLIDYLKEKIGEKGKVVIVKGNHDKIIEPIASRKGAEVKDYYIVGETCFLHGDRAWKEANKEGVKLWIMGHGHPAVKISDGVKIEKYKCFLEGKFKGKKIIIMPSFFEGSVGSDARENDLGLAWKFGLGNFEVKIAGENLEVLGFGKLGKMK